MNEIQSYHFKLNQEANKLLSDNNNKNNNEKKNCLSLEELLKLVINSLDSKNNHNRNQICMHLLHEFRSNRNLSLINLNLFNENNTNPNNK